MSEEEKNQVDIDPDCEKCEGFGWTVFYDPRGPEHTVCDCKAPTKEEE